MSYLLDTNVLYELVKPKPAASVIDWVNSIPTPSLYISVLTLGEIRKGVDGIHDLTRRNKIHGWLEEDLPVYFADRILVIDNKIADMWGRIHNKKPGHSLPAIDGLIAATAIVHHLKLVTRNVKDFINTSVEIINPWAED